jgi:Ca2+/Na+ antiporter
MTTPEIDPPESAGAASAGLPDAPEIADEALREAGIDPDRLSISYLGEPAAAAVAPARAIPLPWAARLGTGFVLWILLYVLKQTGFEIAVWAQAALALFIGLVILQGACGALVTASERLAARLEWDHYVAGTVAEILSTLPELVVIGFLIPVSPLTAFVIALVTIYNNALVFSIYSYFLPKDQYGRYLMPRPITGAGTQLLVAGAAIGLILGLVMMAMSFSEHPKKSFAPADLISLGVLMLTIFCVYLYKLLREYAKEEVLVSDALELTQAQMEERRALVYTRVHESSWTLIAGYLLVGILGAMLGGEQVATFASIAIRDLQLNELVAALVLAGFAGMSEYVILWQSHRKGEHGIALANSFGGITQVMFMVLPFTLIAIGSYQALINPNHPELPLPFSFNNMLLLMCLFPMFFVLIELLEEDHTLGLLDTTIMVTIFLLLIVLLLSYGATT